MARLGDAFPEPARREHVIRQLTPGRVLRLFCKFTCPPNEKFLALVCPGPLSLFFVINSSISRFIRTRPDLCKCQVPLAAADHAFLRHDSFLDCSEVVELRMDDVVADLVADLTRISGALSFEAIERVIDAVRGAKTISPAHKKAIEAALGSAKPEPEAP